MEGVYTSAGRRGQGGASAAEPGRSIRAKVWTEPCAAWSDDCDRAAMARWGRDSCSGETSEGDRTKAGAQERRNSEQSDQIGRKAFSQDHHSQTPFLKGRDKNDPSLILCRNKALSDLLRHLCRQPD